MKPTHPLLYCYYKQFLQSLKWPVTLLFGWHVQKLHSSFIFTTQHQLPCLSKENGHVSTSWIAWFLSPAPIQNSSKKKGLLVLTTSFRLWDIGLTTCSAYKSRDPKPVSTVVCLGHDKCSFWPWHVISCSVLRNVSNCSIFYFFFTCSFAEICTGMEVGGNCKLHLL